MFNKTEPSPGEKKHRMEYRDKQSRYWFKEEHEHEEKTYN